jgi:hypothetical protein
MWRFIWVIILVGKEIYITHIPVYLGDIEVDSLLYYAGAVRIVYMMFLSFDGFPIRAPILATLADEAIRILQAIYIR